MTKYGLEYNRTQISKSLETGNTKQDELPNRVFYGSIL